MSMSSVTEAPPWRHERPAVRWAARRFSLRAPLRLELVGADSSQLSFVSRSEALAPLFLCPWLLVLSGLPWLGPQPLDATRATTSAVCLAAAAGLAAWTWPRRRRLQVVQRGVSTPEVRVVSPGKVRWVLDSEHAPGAARTTYRVTLETDAQALAVLQNTDPERLLWQFSEVLRHWPGPVDCRWGLPATARPWSIEPESAPRSLSDGEAQSVGVVPLAHRPLIWCARLMTAFVVIDVAFLLSTGSAGLAHIHALSVALAATLVSCLFALTFALTSGSSRLLVGGSICRETALFGVRRRRGDVRVESVRGVHTLGATGAERWHLLIDSADGPLALDVSREQAASLARDAERAIIAARSREAPRRSGSFEAIY